MKKRKSNFVPWQPELSLIKDRPKHTIDQNKKTALTNYEKLALILNSKTTVILLSILTLGFYYIYYLFCLEQESPNPFNSPRRFKYEKKPHESESFQEIMKMDGSFNKLISSSLKFPNFQELIGNILELFLKITIFFSSLGCCVAKKYLRFKGDSLDSSFNLKELKIFDEVSKEEKIKKFISRTLQLSEDYHKDFDFAKSISVSVSKDLNSQHFNGRIYDFFTIFVIVISYVLASVLTLGLIPLYHLCLKFRGVGRSSSAYLGITLNKDFISRSEFESGVRRLTKEADDVDSFLNDKLINSVCFDSTRSLPVLDIYRTEIFRSFFLRRALAIFLTAITFGLFGIYLIAKGSQKKKDEDPFLHFQLITKSPYPTVGAKYTWFEKTKNRTKYFVNDLWWDLKAASSLALSRQAKISSNIKTSAYTNSKLFCVFLNAITSPTFKWVFSIFWLILFVVGLSLFWVFIPYSIAFYCWLGLGLLFLVALFYHVNLLFL